MKTRDLEGLTDLRGFDLKPLTKEAQAITKATISRWKCCCDNVYKWGINSNFYFVTVSVIDWSETSLLWLSGESVERVSWSKYCMKLGVFCFIAFNVFCASSSSLCWSWMLNIKAYIFPSWIIPSWRSEDFNKASSCATPSFGLLLAPTFKLIIFSSKVNFASRLFGWLFSGVLLCIFCASFRAFRALS